MRLLKTGPQGPTCPIRKTLKCYLLVTFGLVLVVGVSCGKKGPPFLPKRSIPFKVEALNSERRDGVIILKGKIVATGRQKKDISNIMGCKVYHAWYAPGDEPCKGCPIEYNIFGEIRGEVIIREGFFCRVPGIKKKGIHFFEVRLIGREGTIGPRSNRAKLELSSLRSQCKFSKSSGNFKRPITV